MFLKQSVLAMLQTELWSMHVIVAMLASGSWCKEANLCKILKCQKLKADDLTKMLGGRSGMFIFTILSVSGVYMRGSFLWRHNSGKTKYQQHQIKLSLLLD